MAAAALLLAACAPQIQDQPTLPIPTPFPEIASPPWLEAWAVERILEFRNEQELAIGFGLEVLEHEQAVQRASDGEIALVVSSARPPEDWFGTPLGREPIGVALHPENPVRRLTVDDLQALFSGRLSSWTELGGRDVPVQLVAPLRGTALRTLLEDQILEGRLLSVTALLGPSPAAVREIVAERPGAVALLPQSAADGSVSYLPLNPPLGLDVIGIAPEEPGGLVREWLFWLQSRRD